MVNTASLTEALPRLRTALAATQLPLPLAGAAEQAVVARQMVDQIDDYVLPRLINLDAPLLVVVGGSTGAGKSTLVNSLLGRVVSATGVIRPTTRSPVLVHNPADEGWFYDGRVLNGLARTKQPASDTSILQLVSEPSLPAGLAILDAPDIDSVVAANRTLATQLLEAADLWLFVTSAARYSDAVPWEYLKDAAARSVSLAIVLDRTPADALTEIRADLARLLAENGLGETPVFAIPETPPDAVGLLPNAVVAPVRGWLVELVSDAAHRQQVVVQTLAGAIGAITTRAFEVAEAIDMQQSAIETLNADATSAYREAGRAISDQSSNGTLLRGEVMSRWHEYVGTTQIAKLLDEKVGWLRDKISSFLRPNHRIADHVQVAASSGLAELIWEVGNSAAERASAAWSANPAGRPLIAEHPELGRASIGYREGLEREIRAWQADVLELVAGEGQDKRKTARIAAAGVNGVGAALMLVIFASTGGLTGAEIGVAGGTTVLAQRLLESIFGDDAVRRLTTIAKSQLDERVDALLAAELVRFTRLTDAFEFDPDSAQAIRDGIADVLVAQEGSFTADDPEFTGGVAGLDPAVETADELLAAVPSEPVAAAGAGAGQQEANTAAAPPADPVASAPGEVAEPATEARPVRPKVRGSLDASNTKGTTGTSDLEVTP